MLKCLLKQIFHTGLVTSLLIVGCSQQSNNSNYPNQENKISDCRKVKHALGESCIPLNPQRIVVTDAEMLEKVVALGFQPVGTAKANIAGSKAPVLKGKLEEIVDLGKQSQPNLEKMLQLNPDLILGLGISDQNYNLYSKMAPTVTFDYYHADWKDNLRLVAQALGKTEKAEQLLSEYENRIQNIQKNLTNQQENIEISTIRFYAGHKFTQFQTPLSFSGSVLKEVGFAVPQQQIEFKKDKDSDDVYATVNQEKTEVLDADVLFIALDPGSEKNFQRFQNNPLWQKLNVVKNQRTYTVNSGYWIFGNILSANAILDDINKYIVKDKLLISDNQNE
ncbi:ABC transporter, iron(III) dicitrate-binding periplasmic protein [Calothrix parasitica NIES-267]|uniref:ABC transporter, iron(III) dicitrate-binding periplasmic protein n=1 Tax=Calothrix parasitica NIES-267 TaxID=1973488 RepID=A0A1Z4LY27_9CYAN|nr:ABC transporter, iron(III) dicitrate-binding periplasmic protein [Calothrix parasitica NIES-267]